MTRSRALAALVGLVGLVAVWSSGGVAHAGHVSARAQLDGTTGTAVPPWSPTVDFPNLPRRCYDHRGGGAPYPRACRITRFEDDRPSIVLWGDSHAQQYLTPLRRAVRDHDVNLVAFLSGSCPPAWSPRRPEPYPHCETKNLAALDWIRTHDRAGERVTVVLGSSWSRWRAFHRLVRADERAGRPARFDATTMRVIELAHAGTPAAFRALGRLAVPVDVVGISATPVAQKPPCPEGEDPYRCALPREDVLIDERATGAFLARQMGRLAGPAHYVDTTSAYCDATWCLGTVRGVPTYFDAIHLSESLTRTMTRYFRPTVRRAAAGEAAAQRVPPVAG